MTRTPIKPARPWPSSRAAHLLLALLACAALAAAPNDATFVEGQKVEVREGDTWSAASVLKREGRKYLVHYDGATPANDEWVAPDRIRSSTPTTAPAASRPAPLPFTGGDKVDYKSGAFWHAGVVVNTRGRWTLVQRDGGGNAREWVEPWRLRKRGSTEDAIGWPDSHGNVRNGEGPPAGEPGPPLLANESARDAQKRQARAAADALAPATPADKSTVAQVAVAAVDNATPFTPDAEGKMPRPPTALPIVMRGASDEFTEKDEGIFFASAEVGLAAVCHEFKEATTVERFNLAAGTALNAVQLPGQTRVLALSADGKRVLARSLEFGFGKNDRLDVWDVTAPAVKHVVSFKPYDEMEGGDRDVHWAAFLADGRIATLNAPGRLIAWEPTAKAAWEATVAHDSPAAVSANGKQLALLAGDLVVVLDARDGKPLRTFPGPSATGHRGSRGGKFALCFKPDGTSIALSQQDLLWAFDLPGGKLAHDLSPFIPGGDTLTFVGDGYLLAGGGFMDRIGRLVGLEQQVVVWSYLPAKSRRCDEGAYFAGRFWYTVRVAPPAKGKSVLIGVVVPDPKVLAAVSKIAADPASFAVAPGASVSLQVDLPDDIKQLVTDVLKVSLQKNGVTIAEGQPVKLVAATEQGKSKEMTYVPTPFGAPILFGAANSPNATKLSVAEVISRLSFVDADGKRLWSRESVTGAPMSLQHKKDQGIAEAVAEAMKPRAAFFTDTPLPKVVAKGGQQYGRGASQLSAQGVLPADLPAAEPRH